MNHFPSLTTIIVFVLTLLQHHIYIVQSQEQDLSTKCNKYVLGFICRALFPEVVKYSEDASNNGKTIIFQAVSISDYWYVPLPDKFCYTLWNFLCYVPIPTAEKRKNDWMEDYCPGLQVGPMYEQVAVLVKFYYSTTLQWENSMLDNREWLTGCDPCAWTGVLCFRKRVVELSMSETFFGDKLQGSIPSELSQLSSLAKLMLQGHELSGNLPPDIGKWLLFFDASDNRLTGTIPPNLASDLTLTINVSSNQLTGPIPQNLTQQKWLRILDLSNNSLSGVIPETLGEMRRLNELYINYNDITGTIPAQFCDIEPDISVADCYEGYPPQITCACCTSCCSNDANAIVPTSFPTPTRYNDDADEITNNEPQKDIFCDAVIYDDDGMYWPWEWFQDDYY